VKLAALESRDAFALLGPGFGGGGWVLLSGLGEASGPPDLVYAPFETPGNAPRRFVAGRREVVTVELEPPLVAPRVGLRAEGYHEAVARIREAIAAGDVYQVCHTVRAEVRIAGGAELLSAMCRRGVPRFAAWLRLPGGEEFVSASPELFFETDGRRIHTEPMKGTARSGRAGALEASAKDRAELAMITDLLRNDLTPVCRPQTVRVTCDRRTLVLPYALQTVSDIAGELNDGATPLDALAALHPGGSVTGAPKAAALAMIRDLEAGPRGAYCGALGLCAGERSVFSLLIRTASRTGEEWVYGVGSGVVWDSDADAELAELHLKLGALWSDTPSS
jgi:para-aminobenzoate synthetase/4-amino-4-deoxychorismate lyase